MSYKHWQNPFTYTPPDYDSRENKDDEDFGKGDKRYCVHDWKAILLINSTVYNCCKCDLKKEDYENGI